MWQECNFWVPMGPRQDERSQNKEAVYANVVMIIINALVLRQEKKLN